jgi:hypothetical protein
MVASVWDVGNVESCTLPGEALTQRYRASGAYADCFFTELPRLVTHAEYVEAFYTTGLFRLERWILRLIGRPSTDAEVRALARGERDSFAAWTVEARVPNQVLLRDFAGRTCSWLMVTPAERVPGTRLYFGSVVNPVRDTVSGQMKMPPVHARLLGFHTPYSRLLLRAAARRLG